MTTKQSTMTNTKAANNNNKHIQNIYKRERRNQSEQMKYDIKDDTAIEGDNNNNEN